MKSRKIVVQNLRRIKNFGVRKNKSITAPKEAVGAHVGSKATYGHNYFAVLNVLAPLSIPTISAALCQMPKQHLFC